MPSQTLCVRFYGPFSWTGTDDTSDIFSAELGEKAGVYLWTVKYNGGELIYYVGETGDSFSRRMLEHFKEHMPGGYRVYKPEDFIRGIRTPLWPGRYDPKRKTTVAEFLQNLGTLQGPIVDLARLYRFYVAPMECDKQLRQRIEAGIAHHLYAQEGVIIGKFQEEGIRYLGHSNRDIQVFFESGAKLHGIPDFLWV